MTAHPDSGGAPTPAEGPIRQRSATGERGEPGLNQLPEVVAFGGGHGLSASLTALRRITARLTAIATVADDGGSSGRLRAELDCLPPGDLRMAMAALCDDDETGRTWADVLQYRFAGDGGLGGHPIGNLLIAGLWERLGGDPVAGLDMVARLLGARGRVLPMSAVPLEIEAGILGLDPDAPDEFSYIRGQHAVATTTADVRTVRLRPSDPPASEQSVQAVLDADFVILGPGSWFTSVLPHLLVPDLADAIHTTNARRILTLNIQSDVETKGASAAQHLDLLADHAPTLRLDVVLADSRFARDDRSLEAYAESLGAELMVADLAARDGSARHDPLRLASAYAEIMGI